MAYKPEHVIDLESGAIVSAVVHPADQGDTTTLATTLDDAQAKLCAVRDKEGAPGIDEPFALVADKGYHNRKVIVSFVERRADIAAQLQAAARCYPRGDC